MKTFLQKNLFSLTKIFILFFIFRIILAFIVWHPDLNNHIDWGIRFWQYGPAKFFAPETNVWSYTWPNQPPATMYMFAGIRKLFELVFGIFWWVNLKIPAFPSVVISFFETNLYPALLKLPAILSDFGIAYLLYKWTNKKFAAVLWLLNPVVWYNSAVWGQYDAVINLFALLSFYLLSKKKLVLSNLFLTLSLFTKASLLIFVPIYVVMALRQRYKFSKYALGVTLSLGMVGVLCLPFSGGKEPLSWLWKLYIDKIFVQQMHVITANAFNFWAGLTGIYEQPETLPFVGFTFKAWGFILFTLSYIPTLYLVYKKQDTRSLMWALSISAFSSFMLLTNMHERYLFPLFAPFTALVVFNPKLLPVYAGVSGINLINMWHLWWIPKVQVFIDIMSARDRLVPRVLGFINFGLFSWLYGRFLRLLGSTRLE